MATSQTSSKAGPTIRGAESIPFSILQKKVGKGCAEWIRKNTAKMVRDLSPNRDLTKSKLGAFVYKPYSWTTSESVYNNVVDHMDELLAIDPRAEGLLTRGDINLQDIGTIPPTLKKRSDLKLPDPMADKHFLRCIDASVLLLKEGLLEQLPTDKEREQFEVKAKIKKMSGRGFNCDCASGEKAVSAAHDIILPLINEKGVFAGEKTIAPACMGNRRAPSGTVEGTNGELTAKVREAVIHQSRDSSELTITKHNNGTDGLNGMRVRLVTSVDTIQNIPLVICNAAVMDNLSKKAKLIFKSDYLSLQEDSVGYEEICTDFSQFEFTITRDTRHYAAKQLYSERVFDVVAHIDKMPMAGAYTRFPTSEERDADVVYWYLDRWNDPELAEMYQHLMSGTGDTALMGKLLGFASMLHHLCKAMNVDPFEACAIGDPTALDCIAATVCRNSGDDARAILGRLRDIGYSDSAVKDIITAFEKSLEVDRIFDITVEDPSKYIGSISHREGAGGVHDKVWAVTHDPLTFFAGRLTPEQPAGSPLRGLEYTGLLEGMKVYGTTLVGHGVWTEEQFDHNCDLLLDLIDAPFDMERLELLATEELEAHLKEEREGDLALVISGICKKLDIPHIGMLDYKVTTDEIYSKLTEEERLALWIPIPPELTRDVRRFINL